MSSAASVRAEPRVQLLDAARSLALLAMVCFHFGVDLELFGLAPRGMTTSGGWWWAARLIAGSFLFLAGVSLVLAHGRGIRWPAFWRRFALLAAAAAVVSLSTYVAMPGQFIHFGILHSIAAASLLGLAFLRLPLLAVIAAAAAVFWIGNSLSLAAFDHPALWWTGLAPPGTTRPALDFEPIFPWFAAFLAGLASAKLASALGLWTLLARANGPWLNRLGWPGRHSLAVYLVHQPLLLAGFSLARWLGLI